MLQRLNEPTSTIPSVETDSSLFWGIWLRWQALSLAEQFICTNIVLLPVWWLLGIQLHLLLLIFVSIVLYEWRRYGELRLKRPSLAVIALLAYYTYGYIDTLLMFFDANPAVDLPSSSKLTAIDLVKSTLGFSLPCLVWYIQSNNIRVRHQVVAWACSVCVVQMLLFWLLVQFVFPGTLSSPPPPSVYGWLTRSINTDHSLEFYYYGRFKFFFNHDQACAAFLGFTGLLALDVRNRWWSLLLLAACVFLLTLSATRSVWIAFPAALFIRFLLTTGKSAGAWLVFALIGLTSFITLSLSPVTNLVFDVYNSTATAVDNVRPGSTDVRYKIYTETLERIPDKLFFGHKVQGESVEASKDGNKHGSHSFILGTLYIEGLVGAGLFATFWLSLIGWLYHTRSGRPLCWLPIMFFFNLVACVTVLQLTMSLGTLVCLVMRKPAAPLRRNTSVCVN